MAHSARAAAAGTRRAQLRMVECILSPDGLFNFMVLRCPNIAAVYARAHGAPGSSALRSWKVFSASGEWRRALPARSAGTALVAGGRATGMIDSAWCVINNANDNKHIYLICFYTESISF
jgi:hypothetical protein